MPEWIKKKTDRGKYLSLPSHPVEYEQLVLADDTLRIEIHKENEQPRLFYPYFIRMSGPLIYNEAKDRLSGPDAEEVKRRALVYLRLRLLRAVVEIDELLLKDATNQTKMEE